MLADGGVQTNMADEDTFYGKCTISSESGVIAGYCLGGVLLTGTALILADEQLYLFNPDAALDPEWSPMDGSRGAILAIDPQGEITLSRLPGLDVVSLSEW